MTGFYSYCMRVKYIKISDYFESGIDLDTLSEKFGEFKIRMDESPYRCYNHYHYLKTDDFEILIPYERNQAFNIITKEIESSNSLYKKVCKSVGCNELVPYKEVSYCGEQEVDLSSVLDVHPKTDSVNLSLTLGDMKTLELKSDSEFSLMNWIENNENPSERELEVVSKIEENPGVLKSAEKGEKSYKIISEEIRKTVDMDDYPKSEINGIDVYHYPCDDVNIYYAPRINRIFGNTDSNPEKLEEKLKEFNEKISEEEVDYEITADFEKVVLDEI